jgi:hypothetical protein
MKTLLLLFASAFCALAQTTPDCQFTYTAAIATSQTPPINNRFTTAGGANGCSAWTLKYWTNAASATSVQIEGAADAVVAGVHVPSGSYTALTVAAPTGSGANPATGTTSGSAALCCDYYPWIRITVNTLTSSGAGTIIEVRVYGYRNNSAVNGNGGGGGTFTALSGDATSTATGGATTVTGVNGAAVPASAALAGTNSSKQLIAADANARSAPAYVAGAGIAQAQTATLVPAITALVAGRTAFCWLPLHANTGAAPTIAVNGLTATAIVKVGGAALVAGDITTTAVACVIYDGTSFELQNPQTSTGGPPTGAAGGDLGGVYPNPTVAMPLLTTDIATPANPAGGKTKSYSKGGKWCSLDPSGSENCTGASGGGGGLVLLEQHTASNSADLEFTTALSSTYDVYQVEFVALVPATTSVNLWMRVATSGTAWDTAANYSWANARFIYVGTTTNGGSGASNSTQIVLHTGSAELTNVANNGGVSGFLKLYNWNIGGAFPHLTGEFDAVYATPIELGGVVGGTYQITTPIVAFQFLFSSGNIVSGTVRVYGLAK